MWTLTVYLPSRVFVVDIQSLSHVWLFVTPWIAARQTSLSPTISQSLPKFMSIDLVMWFNHLILCYPTPPPALCLSQHQGFFSSELTLCIRWPKYWSFNFSISPSNIQGWFPVELLVWSPLLSKGLSRVLQHHSLKASILRRSVFFMIIHIWLLEKVGKKAEESLNAHKPWLFTHMGQYRTLFWT